MNRPEQVQCLYKAGCEHIMVSSMIQSEGETRYANPVPV